MPRSRKSKIEEEIDEGDDENVAGIGDNSGDVRMGGVAKDQLRSIIDRIEKLEEEEAAVKADKADVYREAKGNGYDVKALRQIIKERKVSQHDREEHEAVVYTYKRALDMIPYEDGTED